MKWLTASLVGVWALTCAATLPASAAACPDKPAPKPSVLCPDKPAPQTPQRPSAMCPDKPAPQTPQRPSSL